MNGTDRAFVDRFYLAPTLFRLGELYESANDTKRATEYYGRFVDLWRNADPEPPAARRRRARTDGAAHFTVIGAVQRKSPHSNASTPDR